MIINFTYDGKEFSNFNILDLNIREQLESKGIDLVLITKQEIKKQLLLLEKQRLQEILDTYGYNGLADVQFYANQNDTEAQALLNWYQAYDDAIWAYIDNDLQTFTTVDELLALDMRQVEQRIFEQAIQESPLP